MITESRDERPDFMPGDLVTYLSNEDEGTRGKLMWGTCLALYPLGRGWAAVILWSRWNGEPATELARPNAIFIVGIK